MPSRLALKFLQAGAKGPYSGFVWPVPNGRPGKWVSVRGALVPCENGVHACTLDQALDWLQGEAYLIELGGRVLDEDGKLCARKGRLIRRLQWDSGLFAADCAERVLHIWEERYPDDDRPRRAIEACRAFSRGEIDAAARSAAWSAAWSAAASAAWSAERGAQIKLLVRHLHLTRDELSTLGQGKGRAHD